MRTLKELATEALEIQNACNLCGLAQRFAKVQIELGEHVSGTDERNRHPITILWLDKFNSLARIQSHSKHQSEALDSAYDWVHTIVSTAF